MNPNKGHVMRGWKAMGLNVKLSETQENATVFRRILSAVVKSVSKKCLLHKYFWSSILVSVMLQ
jgi:hypothetical protein